MEFTLLLSLSLFSYVRAFVHSSVLPLAQNFLFKCIGIVLRKSTNKNLIQGLLNAMFGAVKHANNVEREVGMKLSACHFFRMRASEIGEVKPPRFPPQFIHAQTDYRYAKRLLQVCEGRAYFL